jgi:hypothetical protein
MAFEDTPNKATIRRLWDMSILESWHIGINRPLAYFGLPGPEIRDLLDWGHLLSTRTAVESSGRTRREMEQADETVGRLLMNVMAHEISSNFELLRGDIEDVILNALDKHGNPPRMNDGHPAHLAHFMYDVVNLDFDGGLGYRNKAGPAKRINAIKKLFERQEGHSFVLFLTINVRDTLGEEIEDYLKGLQSYDRGIGWRETLDWYLSRSNGEREYKLKATVPSFIQAIAETRVFECISRPPIFYEGFERAHMIHFSFEFKAVERNGRFATLKGFSPKDERDLLDLPLLQSNNSHLQIASMQHPNFDYARCKADFDFLPEDVRSSLLEPIYSLITEETKS